MAHCLKTSCWGTPFLAKMSLNSSIVLAAVVLCIITTSSHFEYESTTIKNMRPMKGPAKSICILCHGPSGQAHDGVGPCLADFALLDMHCMTLPLMQYLYLCMLGHHTGMRAKDFMRTIPG